MTRTGARTTEEVEKLLDVVYGETTTARQELIAPKTNTKRIAEHLIRATLLAIKARQLDEESRSKAADGKKGKQKKKAKKRKQK